MLRTLVLNKEILNRTTIVLYYRADFNTIQRIDLDSKHRYKDYRILANSQMYHYAYTSNYEVLVELSVKVNCSYDRSSCDTQVMDLFEETVTPKFMKHIYSGNDKFNKLGSVKFFKKVLQPLRYRDNVQFMKKCVGYEDES